MRFLSMVRINEASGQKPDERLMKEMGKLVEEMTRSGALVSTAGLTPTREGKRVRSQHGKISVTDGPFIESKEVVGGYAILEAPSMKEAIEMTRRFVAVHGEDWNVECEVRPLASPEMGAAHQGK
ncbi:MAG TPA: YciI family protein [Usitatibacter sp.]|nr:YciI family protein [Usitatibacter sp.]